MILDQQGHKAFFDYLAAMGFKGSLDDYRTEMQKQSYESRVRLFCDSLLPGVLQEHQAALKFAQALCKLAKARFNYVLEGSSHSPYINFGTSRGTAPAGPGIRLEGVSLDFEIRDRYVNIRVQCYLSGEQYARRDTTIRFTRDKKGHTYER